MGIPLYINMKLGGGSLRRQFDGFPAHYGGKSDRFECLKKSSAAYL